MGECGAILKVVEPIRSFVFDAISEYVGYIGSCEDNLDKLHKSLNEVCIKKDDIKKKVKVGNDKLEDITTEALSWLHGVQMLTEEEDMKELMYKDINTAKFVVKMMGKKNLKRRISKESGMQEVVVKVMRRLKEEMEECEEEEMKKMRKADYKHVAEVVVEVMQNTFEEFKKLMKEDKKMAIIAMRSLKGEDLDKLIRDDLEMEEIVREAMNASDEEHWGNHDDEESTAPQPLLAKVPAMDGGNNRVKEAAKKLFTPLANLITPLGKMMDDANFKKDMPEAGGVKLGLDVIDGLLIRGRGLNKEIDDSTKQHRGCCCCSFSLCENYHGRYLMSKKAEFIVKHIQNDLISKCPRDPVTLRKRTVDLKPIPTQFFEGLVSRTKILDQILESLNNDQVNAVGVFGMGGAGKTTLAKQVIKRTKDAFAIKVMVEISDAPDIARIQATIAESIDLPLHDVSDVAQRAVRLYNKLSDSKKDKKILIILDNVWKKLNLDEIGIPNTCKLFLTTRDREVCRVMNVRDVNILEVGVMNTNEARELFKSVTGNRVDAREYKIVVERLLSKCGGLPLAIVATANTLKDKDYLSSWENFADDLEKPISSRSSGDYRHTFSILNTSYKFIQVEGKRVFFLLACLSPLGSSISVERLMRIGMGLNLFEHVNKLSEAMKQAVTWADELMLSSLLLEGDVKGDVKIHDIVRDFAISCAAEEEKHRFMVEGIPRWLDGETLKKYTGMLLASKNDYSRVSGLEGCKLRILILKGDMSPNFDDFFFNGMVNLEVLALSNMKFQPSLPESMRKLKNLRTLCMEGCKLGNIELVGELQNLLVLSLCESFVENLSDEVGNLCNLRLLDLSGCTTSWLPLISTRVLEKLSRLEGFYIFNDTPSVFKVEDDYEVENDSEEENENDSEENENGSEIQNDSVQEKENDSVEEENADEIIRLPYLNALEINILAEDEQLSIDSLFIRSLDRFRIFVGEGFYITEGTLQKSTTTLRNFCCILNLDHIFNLSNVLKKSCLEVLLSKVDFLEMTSCRQFVNLVPQLNHEGFRCLKSLRVSLCYDFEFIVDGNTMNNFIVFPCLQSLTLNSLTLKVVCSGDVFLPGSFSNLQTIKFSYLSRLLYGLPLLPLNVNEILVNDCGSLMFMFLEDGEEQPIEMPFLKRMEFRYVHDMLSFVGPKKFSNTCELLQGPQAFFDEKIVFPSLELFVLENCKNVVKLWSKEIYPTGFQNLKDVQITDCKKLSSVGSSSVFSTLEQLETLRVRECEEMREVISGESEISEQVIVFPRLKHLELGALTNLESFYRGGSKLEFPKLKKLILDRLGSMKSFVKFEKKLALFHDKIDFPYLEELHVMNLNAEVMGLWDKKLLSVTSSPAPKLRQLSLGSSARRLPQVPSVVLENLSSLTLTQFHEADTDVVFSSSELGVKDGFVWTYSQLPNLEELKVKDCQSLKELFDNQNDCNADADADAALMLFCGQFKTLELKILPSLNLIPLHLFKSVVSLTLDSLKWNYLTSAHVLEDSLHQLEFLSIESCDNLEALVINVGSHIKLPRLTQLRLRHLGSYTGISSTPEKEAVLLLPSLESLVIEYCENLEHFWSASIEAPRLQEVSMKGCAKMKQFFVGNVEDTIELPSLQTVSLWYCTGITSFSSASLTALNLRKVKLDQCYKMECFLPENPIHDGDLRLLSLENVKIRSCPLLKAFSTRRVLAPKLTRIKSRTKYYSILAYDGLNGYLTKTTR